MEKMITLLLLLIVKEGTWSSGWSVTFENQNPCALKGSSVEFRCSYNYAETETVRETAWYKGDNVNGTWKRIKLSALPSYENRSEYLGDQQHDCSLAIHDLGNNDQGHYYFRFDTDTYGRRSKESVHLSVTELRANVYPKRVRVGDNVTLECKTSCNLPNTIWFRDGCPVAKPEFQAQAEDSGHYSCALKGWESEQSDPVALDVQHPPINLSIEVSHPGHLAEGSSVNLTCSSVANPAVEGYTWYKRIDSPSNSSGSVSGSGSGPMLQVGSGQVLSLPSAEASHAGFYLCQARNSVGGSNSPEVLLTMTRKKHDSRFILLVGLAVKVVLVLFIPLVFIWAWKRRHNSAAEENEDSLDYENIANG